MPLIRILVALLVLGGSARAEIDLALESGALFRDGPSRDHTLTLALGARAGVHVHPALSLLAGYGLSRHVDQVTAIRFTETLHRFWARADLTLGRFVAGVGPAVFLEHTSVDGRSGTRARPGLVAALGLRFEVGRWYAAFELGGEQRGGRRDFVSLLIVGATLR